MTNKKVQLTEIAKQLEAMPTDVAQKEADKLLLQAIQLLTTNTTDRAIRRINQAYKNFSVARLQALEEKISGEERQSAIEEEPLTFVE